MWFGGNIVEFNVRTLQKTQGSGDVSTRFELEANVVLAEIVLGLSLFEDDAFDELIVLIL